MPLDVDLKHAAARPDVAFDFDAALCRGAVLRRRRLLTAVTVVVAVVAITAVPMVRAVRPPDVAFVPAPSDREAAPDRGDFPAAWRRIDAGPLAPVEGATTVWTGSALLVWGGRDVFDEKPSRAGALYDPQTGRWQTIADAPIGGEGQQVGSWADDRLFVWSANRGAVYVPDTDTWGVLPEAPVDVWTPFGSIWTGSEFIVFGSTERGRPERQGVAYDPATRRWRQLPLAPGRINRGAVLWTGQEMLVFGSEQQPFNNLVIGPRDRTRMLAYRPASDSWRRLPDAPVEAQAPTAVWTGQQVIAWSYALGDAAAYDPERRRWRPIADLPFDASECAPEGVTIDVGTVYAVQCGNAALYDVAGDRWRRAKAPMNLGHSLVWTGDRLLSWWSMGGLDRAYAWSNP